MPNLSGNKGEWSEIYVFLRLLEIGKLYAADADLNKMDDVFYNICDTALGRVCIIMQGQIINMPRRNQAE